MKKTNLKLLGLSINKPTGALKVQALEFDQKSGQVIKLKGAVGSGKTTTQKLFESTTQGKEQTSDSQLYGDAYEYAVKLGKFSDGQKEQELTVQISKSAGEKPVSKLQVIGADGKRESKPMWNGENLTVSRFHDLMKTILSFRTNELFSDNPTVVRNLLVEMYRDQMEEYGIGISPKSPKYKGSLEEKLAIAIQSRADAYAEKRRLSAFKEQFKEEGIDLDNITDLHVVVKDFDSQIKSLTDQYNALLSDIRVSNATAQSSREAAMEKIKNEASEITRKIADKEREAIQFNDGIAIDIKDLKAAEDAIIDIYNKYGIAFKLDQVVWDKIANAKKPLPEKKDGNYISCPWPEMATDWKRLQELRTLFAKTISSALTPEPCEPSENGTDNQKKLFSLTMEIQALEAGKAANEGKAALNRRIEAYYEWAKAEMEVYEIRQQIFIAYEKINTGVAGLNIQAVQKDESDEYNIKLMYDGQAAPELFNNPKKEMRTVAGYSGTQRPLIGLLMHISELKKKDTPLLASWLDCPIDKRTIEFLEALATENELTIFVNVTGDFDKDKLMDGEIIIEDGYLFMKN